MQTGSGSVPSINKMRLKIRLFAMILVVVLSVSQVCAADYSLTAASGAPDVSADADESPADGGGENSDPETPADQESPVDPENPPVPSDVPSEAAALPAEAETTAAGEAKATGTRKSKLLIAPGISDKEAIGIYGTYTGKNAKRIPVITYHRVVSDAQKRRGSIRKSSLYISQSSFNSQMKWLSKHHYRTISCQEFYLWYTGKIKLPKKSVLITFDDSRACIAKYAFPVLKKYNLKATVFTIGHGVVGNKKDSIKKRDLKKLQKKYPDIEYQSHTYALHHHFPSKGDYKVTKKDAAKQKKLFGFEYIAYPYGRSTPGMRKAYKAAGMKLGFSYGTNGYATRKQNRFQIMRIKIYGNASLRAFTKWFR